MDYINYIKNIWKDHIPGIPPTGGTAAVVIPLLEKEGEYHILFEERASTLVHQPGEICFPGGRVEEGESPREAALREAEEELLLDGGKIEILAALDAAMGPTGAPIWPFAALLHDYHDTFSEDEVARVFTIPLSWFADHEPERYMTRLVTVPGDDFPYELIPGGRNYPFRKKKHEIVFYRTPEAVIWGVTARITDGFLKETAGYFRKEELLDIRDLDGRLTGEVKSRDKVHEDGDLHGTSHVWILRANSRGSCDLLLQKRSADKDSFPGCYDISSAGHIPAGQDYLPSALRELYEELGIRAEEGDLICIGMHEGYAREVFYGKPFINHEISRVYIYTKPVDPEKLTLQKEEVESVVWMDIEECFRRVRAGDPDYIMFLKELEMIRDWYQKNGQGSLPQ